jgi:hypothetical protein
VDGRGGFGLRRQLCESLFEPSSHIVEQRLGACRANGAAFVCGSSLDLLLRSVERGYAMHCFGGDGRVMRLHQVEELAPDVRHAWSFLNRAALVKLVEAREGVSLQDALELGQMPLRMFALAVGRVCEPHSRRCLVA